jgi:5'-deoxynucleotidase YfbR-like HD superfamily hydrolase
MLIWHDLAETRIGDFHKVGARYIPNKKEIEKQVMKDQLE